MSDAVIEVDDLRRSYNTRTGVLRRTAKVVEAVRGVDFSVQRGELFGLLGPNGAGKTTTIKMLITLLLPTVGVGPGARLRRGGRRPRGAPARRLRLRRRPRPVRAAVRPTTTCATSPSSTRCPRASSPRRIGELVELVGLTGREKERVEGYSRGMRQRLHIARGLLHKPEVLFLDEPSIGIDPVGARELRATVAGLVEQGTTVLLTTHYMFEADELCDRIAVITGGRIVATGTPAELKARVDEGTGRRGRGLRRRRAGPAAGRGAAGRPVGHRRAQRSRPAARRPGDARRRGLAGRARLPGRRAVRPRRHPRAHPRGRLRRAGERRVRTARVFASPGCCT